MSAATQDQSNTTNPTPDTSVAYARLSALAESMPHAQIKDIWGELAAENNKCDPMLSDVAVFRIAKQYGLPDDEPKAEAKTAKAEGRLWPPGLDLVALSKREPLPPSFIVQDLIPAGYATLFAGHGGVGKSGIALYLAVCMVLGIPFFGLPVERRRVVYLSCEDRENILHWRLKRICSYLNIDMAGLMDGLEIIDLVTSPTILWARDPRTGATLSAAYYELERRVQECGSQVVVTDGINDTYGGRGGDSVEIKDFVKSLVRLVPDDTGAVLLVGHISKPAAMGIGGPTSEGYSGATGWHNSVRSRLYLYPETEQDEESARAERTGGLLLEHQKSNFGALAESMRFEWSEDSGLFLGKAVAQESRFDKKHRDRTECEAILEAIKGCEKVGIVVPAALVGQRTCHQVLSIRPEFPADLRAGRPAKKRFWQHIEVLRQSGCVELGAETTPNRHKIATITSTGKACAECANAVYWN